MKETIKGQFVREVIAEMPDAPTKTIARVAYKRAPEMFTDLETARSLARRIRGATGKRNRAVLDDRSMIRPPQPPGNVFPLLPEPKSEWDAEWCAFELEFPARVLILADAHIPYHDKGALETAIKTGKDRGCDTVLLNGDTADFFSISQWEKDPRRRDFPAEVESVKQFLGYIRGAFPNARLLYKVGNHEERFVRYMELKAPELLGVKNFELPEVLGLNAVDATYITDMRPIKAGKLFVIHGHEYRFNISNPVNPARGFFLRAKTHVLGSHLHQSSQHSAKALDGTVISTFSTGCLCSLNPRYRPLNDWNWGFAILSVDKGGAFDVDNLRVIGGRAY